MSNIYLKNLKNFLRKVIRRDETWSIGIYLVDSSLNFKVLTNIRNPVLTAADVNDIQAEFVADPFMIHQNGIWYMFFEALNLANDRGVIALASSSNGFFWEYQQVVLEEPFHLSYPYIFEWDQEYYMVPESYQANEVRLYKAVDFPTRWVFHKTLLRGSDYVDSSLIYFNEKWWMFTSSASNNILRLYYADYLLGDWLEHPNSPITPNETHLARPAGRVSVLGNRLIRFAQDSRGTYGRQVFAFEITELAPDHYAEQEAHHVNPVLKPSSTGWNTYGTHHIDLHNIAPNQWLACADGKTKPIIKIFGSVIEI